MTRPTLTHEPLERVPRRHVSHGSSVPNYFELLDAVLCDTDRNAARAASAGKIRTASPATIYTRDCIGLGQGVECGPATEMSAKTAAMKTTHKAAR